VVGAFVCIEGSEEIMNWYRKHEMLLWGLAIVVIMVILIGASTLVAHNY
jgi:predicted nucleic acid-binding Zn ribbon protein